MHAQYLLQAACGLTAMAGLAIAHGEGSQSQGEMRSPLLERSGSGEQGDGSGSERIQSESGGGLSRQSTASLPSSASSMSDSGGVFNVLAGETMGPSTMTRLFMHTNKPAPREVSESDMQERYRKSWFTQQYTNDDRLEHLCRLVGHTFQGSSLQAQHAFLAHSLDNSNMISNCLHRGWQHYENNPQRQQLAHSLQHAYLRAEDYSYAHRDGRHNIPRPELNEHDALAELHGRRQAREASVDDTRALVTGNYMVPSDPRKRARTTNWSEQAVRDLQRVRALPEH